MRRLTSSVVAYVFLGCLTATPSQAASIVVPNVLANSETPFGSGTLVNASHRSQQVYDASQFSSVTGALLITELRFRPDASFGKVFTTTVGDVRVSLSTTTRGENNLSSQYAQNVGPDESVVFSGALPISSAFTQEANGTRTFDIVISVSPPFYYAPSLGNLLLEIRNLSGSSASYVGGQGVSGDGGSRVIGSIGSNSGFADTGVDALMVVYNPTNAPPPPPPTIVRGPYLQSATLQSLIVRWRTDRASDGFVRFGLSPDDLQSEVVNSEITTEHAIELNGLSAGTKYYYAIGTGTNVLAGGNGHYFVTSPETEKRTRIWAMGDSGTASIGSSVPARIRDAYATFTGTNHTDVWLMLGDNAYQSGTDSEYQAAVFNVFQDQLRTTPLWTTIGNHETYAPGPGGGLAYFDIFSLPQTGGAGGVSSGTERYYSFDYGNIHFVCLDSELSVRTAGSPMLTWLEQDLAANTKDWLIAYWHSPPYSRGSHNSDFEANLVQMRESVVPVLESYGVDLVLCGHSHSYERSYLLKQHYGPSSTFTPAMIVDSGSGQPEGTGAYFKPPTGQGEGTVYVVAGNAGQISGGSLNHPAMFVSLNRLGSMVVDVQSNRLDASFLRETGAVDDHFTIIKGFAAPTIASQPASQSAYVGATAQFTVSAHGTPPLRYQWLRDGVELSGETNATLQLVSVQTNQAGVYTVMVSNDFGSVTSTGATFTVNVAPACVPPPSGIVAWWPFEGDASDLVGTNHGSLRGGAGFGTGRVGQGLVLDGLDDFVLVPDSASLRLTNELTIELWFKGTSANWGGLIDKRGAGRANYGLFISHEDVELYYDQGGGFAISSSSLPSLNEFHHIAGTYRQVSPTSIELKTYLDGQLVRTDALPGNLANTLNNTAVTIGGVSGTCCFFKGVIDEVALYGRALAASEIQAIYSTAIGGKCNQIAPRILAQPESISVFGGRPASFAVSAIGTLPLNYQWLFDGGELSGETNATLDLVNVQTNQAGVYTVKISNDFGSVTSAGATLAVNAAPACVPPPPGIVAWWPFEGDASDLVGTNHGSLRGGAGFGAGRIGQGLVLDGQDDFVLVPDSASLRLTNELTVELWFKGTSANWGGLIDKRGGGRANYGIFISPSNVQLYYDEGGGFAISYSSLPTLNEFHHIAGTYRQVSPTSIELKTYLDGQLVRSDALSGNLANTLNNTPLTIGGVSGTCCFFKGVIDDLTLYGRALAGSEIQAIYTAGIGGKCVTPSAPLIIAQPASQTVTKGSTVSFDVVAIGTLPLGYQWDHNGIPIPGASNATLILTGVQYSQAGNYTVTISNSAGHVTSEIATLSVSPPPSTLRVVDGSATSGGPAEVSVELLAEGFENAVGFSLEFDNNLLRYSGVALGIDAPEGVALLVNTNIGGSGKVGFAIALPADAVFSAGTRQMLRIQFEINAVFTQVSTPIRFADEPTLRQISDALARPLLAQYTSGSLVISAAALEGDVAPRPAGDLNLSIIDWVAAGRFAAGLDTPAANEFQRADCAPRESRGNGILSVADWVQTGRYAAGLDSRTTVGGPSSPIDAAPAGSPAEFEVAVAGARTLSLATTNVLPGNLVAVPVSMAAQGNENALGFSIAFDPARLRIVGVTKLAKVASATLNLNTNLSESGRLGLALALPAGASLTAGFDPMLLLTFAAVSNATGTAGLIIGDQPVGCEIVDVTAHSLGCTYVNGSISFGPATPVGPALTVRRSGQSVVLYWTLNSQGFELHSSLSVTGGVWVKIPVTPIDIGDQLIVTLPATNTQQYFRLIKP